MRNFMDKGQSARQRKVDSLTSMIQAKDPTNPDAELDYVSNTTNTVITAQLKD
jgi:hypothetical protein